MKTKKTWADLKHGDVIMDRLGALYKVIDVLPNLVSLRHKECAIYWVELRDLISSGWQIVQPEEEEKRIEKEELDDVDSLQCPVIKTQSNHCWNFKYHTLSHFPYSTLRKGDKCQQCNTSEVNGVAGCRKCKHCGLVVLEKITTREKSFEILSH